MKALQPIADERDQDIRIFLKSSGWLSAQRAPIPGDASFRRYERISLGGEGAILMDAPPDKEDIAPFVRVDRYLESLGLRAPRILAQDDVKGFLLLEDLGNDLFSRVLRAESPETLKTKEETLYLSATDVLIELFHRSQKHALPSIPVYDEALYLREVQLFSDWFLPAILGEEKAASLRTGFIAVWKQVLAGIPDLSVIPVLRDFHADNLLWLPEGKQTDRVGLLDFQDAVMGSPAYDMVSFLEDARRDVLPETVALCVQHFVSRTGLNPTAFGDAYAILGAQRNTKIIGIFTRLGKRDGKYHYQTFLPRVWGHLMHDLTHPKLKDVREWIMQHVPVHWHNGSPPFPDTL